MESLLPIALGLLCLPLLSFSPGGPLNGRGDREPDLSNVKMSPAGFLVWKEPPSKSDQSDK